MVLALLLFISLFPVVFIAGILYLLDKEKEKFSAMIKYYLLGLLSAVIAVVAELVLGLLVPESNDLILIFIKAFFVIALSEETAKFLCLKIGLKFEKSYDNFYDSIIFATAVSLGFAGIENVLYVIGNTSLATSVGTGLMRAFLAIPGHAIFAIYMGFFLDKAMEAKMQRKSSGGYTFLALLLPITLHGIYDFFCFTIGILGSSIYFLLFVLFIVFMYVSGIMLIVKGVKKSHISFGGRNANPFANSPFAANYGYNVLNNGPRACTKCGRIISGNFCPFCGNDNSYGAPTEIQPTGKYCSRCGNYGTGHFCNKCGNIL